ncbi:hypothetical protein D3C78_1753340 [compost metagenome]
MPVWLPDAVLPLDLLVALYDWPPLVPWNERTLRLLLEDEREGSVRLDQPVAPFAERRFGPRFVKQEVLHVPNPTDA